MKRKRPNEIDHKATRDGIIKARNKYLKAAQFTLWEMTTLVRQQLDNFDYQLNTDCAKSFMVDLLHDRVKEQVIDSLGSVNRF